MMRQLRPFHTPEQLAQIYARPYDHTRWEDHRIRVQVTIHTARWLRDHIQAKIVTDLSCGDGAILQGLSLPRERCVYGDLNSSVQVDFVGRIDETIITAPSSDLFILSETLEHVEDPMLLLSQIRQRHRSLIISTPVGEEGDGNQEHYWGWNVEDIRKLLIGAGFTLVNLTLLDPHVPGGYTYQIWGCT